MLPIDSKYDRIQESTLNGGHALVPTMKYARQENSTATSIAATGTEGAKPSGNATATGPPINGAGHIGVEVGAIVGLVGIVALW